MTEERQSLSSISILHSMLNRLKSSERLQGSAHVTAGHSKDANQSDNVFIPECDKPERTFAGSNPSECTVKPEEQHHARADSEYFTQRTVLLESSPTSTTLPSNFSHNLERDARQDLQPSESNPLWKEMNEEQLSQAKSHCSIQKSSVSVFTNDPTSSSLSSSEPRFVKGATVPMGYEMTKQPCRSENTVSH